jgi:hypothetical protein
MTGLQDPPSVSSVVAALPERRRILVSALRDAALSLDGVEERTLYDHFCREWTPAFYVDGTQLFHVHDFRRGLRATMFVGINTLEPLIMACDEAPQRMRRLLAETDAPRFTKELRVPVNSMDDVAEFVELARVKWAFVQKT